MRIIHIADLHFHRDWFEQCKSSIQTIIKDIRENGADLVAIAGDTWHGPTQNSAGHLFPEFVGLIQAVADMAPVVMIYGTPGHDAEKSLVVFEQMRARHPVVVLEHGKAYGLGAFGTIVDLSKGKPSTPLQLVMFGIPEPNKRWLLGKQEATGKDEADNAARLALQQLMLGISGLRAQYGETPALLLYHGMVLGARTATGYGSENGFGIYVTDDQLRSVNADYIALGHIHQPQQIAGLPAYYPGSIYPKDFGETHKAGANVVIIDGWVPTHGDDLFGNPADRTVVERLQFNHPERRKVSVSVDQLDAQEITEAVRGYITWLDVACTREDALDTDTLLERLYAAGALPGSRVTLNVAPIETVRAGDIVTKQALRDKVSIWAENSSLEVSDAVLSKADELEQQAAGSLSVKGAQYRLDRLVLRGAIGIWKKSRKDEIDLNLAELGPGVLALVGANGAGKTTILENLHPWPCLLTRKGTLKEHFRLRDSCRDLYITDELTGAKYRCLMTIRADIDSGKTEYYLYKDSGRGFEPLPSIDGNLKPYETAVTELFGSLEMYLRTAFVTQRPSKDAPDLSESTPGAKKALFAELAGIDYLDRYEKTAIESVKNLDAQVGSIRAVIAAAQGIEEEISAMEARIRAARTDAEQAETAAREAMERGKALKNDHVVMNQKAQEIAQKQQQRDQLSREIAEIDAEKDRISAEIERYKKAEAGHEAALSELNALEALEREEKTLLDEKANLDSEYAKMMVGFNLKAHAAGIEREQSQKMLDDARNELARIERELAVAKSKMQEPVQDTCPACSQPLPADARAKLEENRSQVSAKVQELEGKAKNAVALVSERSAALSNIRQPNPPAPPVFEKAEKLKSISADIAWYDKPAITQAIRQAESAKVRIEEATKRQSELAPKQREKQAVYTAIDGELQNAPDYRAALSRLEIELEAERAAYTQATSRVAAAKATITAEESAIASAQARLDQRNKAQAKITTLETEKNDWELLAKACGKNGIQALELDALAPGIAEVANRLLAASGNEGHIEFRTTRQGGKGAKVKQIEDFLVFYIDQNGDEQLMDMLSGGESVWIKKALYDAFAIIRGRNTGLRFQTVFLDEADGALDPESRMRYLRMLEEAHAESKRYQTILITHSTELQSMVERVVNVSSLDCRKTKEELAA